MSEVRSRVQENDLLLHEAVIKNEPDAVREALQRPADINCRNNVSFRKITTIHINHLLYYSPTDVK